MPSGTFINEDFNMDNSKIDLQEFEDIRPYNDEETDKALSRVAAYPGLGEISRMIFPDRPSDFLSELFSDIRTVDDFQKQFMSRAVEWVLSTTAREFSFSGLERISGKSAKFLTVSNHRDIILDPAIMQIVLYKGGLPMTQIAVGDNLLKNKVIEDLIRSNRMIKVVRGVNPRNLYASSMLLSRYIRLMVTSGESSVWIAQREGRSKDGFDVTEQGILKMFDMSGGPDFTANFEELNITPMSISYEYEPCDILKARETLIKRDRDYVKGENEDVNSIITGIRQFKGNIHLSICEPLTHEEISSAAGCRKNERYQALKSIIDRRIVSEYRLWKTNYMAYDMMTCGDRYSEHYTQQDLAEFNQYLDTRMASVEPGLDRAALREILLGIYGNPVLAKEHL